MAPDAVERHRATSVLAPDWLGYEGIYGGRVVAELVEAVGRVDDMDLVTLYAEFTGTVRPGEVDVAVDVHHRGRRSSSISVSLGQERVRARATAKSARVGRGEAAGAVPMPGGVPSPDDLAPFEPPYWTALEHCRLMELRLVDTSVTEEGARARLWLRLHDDHPEVAPLSRDARIACLVDAVPPVLFFVPPAPAYVPTLDLALHLRPRGMGPAANGWCFAEVRLVWASADFCLEEVTMWDSTGEVIAQTRQNRRIVREVPDRRDAT